jgi:hypothetical protein
MALAGVAVLGLVLVCGAVALAVALTHWRKPDDGD